ncbi:MAG: BrnA antitoxin family protein [Acidobacteria bacterium]|nr:BrnA antitoxin family protein [Acidobacteriota bacterium]
MNASDTKNSPATNWERIDAMTDDLIDTSDIPPLDEAFFAQAQLRMPKSKVTVTVQFDVEVFEWLKAQAKDYENLINVA